MDTFIFLGVVGIYTLMTLFDAYAKRLNHQARYRPLPPVVADVYDEAAYQRWLSYSGERERLSNIQSLLSFVLILVLLIGGGFRWLAEWSLQTAPEGVDTLLFFGVLALFSMVLSMPFRYYRTFSIEERYGFNRSTRRTFFTDRLKGAVLVMLLGGVLLGLLVFAHATFGAFFFLAAFAGVMVVLLFINLFYVRLILPLFNRLEPLEEGTLKNRIEALAAAEDYEIAAISVMDASRRSSKLNAFFSGFSRFRRVVLFDTLLERFDEDEVLAVVAHEVGHAKHRDARRNLFFSAVSLLLLLVLLYAFVESDALYDAFGLEEAHFGFALLVFSLVARPITLLLDLAGNAFTRRMEYRADAFAAARVDADTMVRVLKRLARENYSHLTPHPLYVMLHYSHPPIKDRIAALQGESA